MTTAAEPFRQPDNLFNTQEHWTWVGCYGGYYLTSNAMQAAGFEHGFFTRLWQNRGPDALAAYLSAGVSVHRPRQVHGNRVLNADEASASPWPEADGLVSNRGGQSLWVCGADCTPVLLADPTSGHVAACHAGWRGVATGILPAAIRCLTTRGAKPEQLIVALGPAVSGALYQVETTVAEQVGQALDSNRSLKLSDMEALGILLPDPEPNRCRLDIRLAAREQLQRCGIPDQQICLCPLCTVSEPSLFHSWRRDQVKAVQWSGIVGQAADSSE
jgi:YfiH family protein